MMIKKRRADITFPLLCAVTIAFAAGVGTAAAQPSGPKTVADFILLVPERYMGGYDLRFREEMLRGEHRGRGIAVLDGRGRKLYTLTWRGDRFRLDRRLRR